VRSSAPPGRCSGLHARGTLRRSRQTVVPRSRRRERQGGLVGWSIRQGRWTAAVTDALAPARSHPGRQRSRARLTSRHHRLETTSRRRSITAVPDLRPRHPAPDAPVASRYSSIIVSIEELRIGIERHLEELSKQVDRLRAALEALGPGDPAHVRSATGRTPRATSPRGRRAPRLGATPRVVRGNGRALSAVAIAGSGAGPASPPTLSPVASEATTLSAECEDMLPQVAANDLPAGAAEGEATAAATGADRALHELRSELAAGLRSGRS